MMFDDGDDDDVRGCLPMTIFTDDDVWWYLMMKKYEEADDDDKSGENYHDDEEAVRWRWWELYFGLSN